MLFKEKHWAWHKTGHNPLKKLLYVECGDVALWSLNYEVLLLLRVQVTLVFMVRKQNTDSYVRKSIYVTIEPCNIPI